MLHWFICYIHPGYFTTDTCGSMDISNQNVGGCVIVLIGVVKDTKIGPIFCENRCMEGNCEVKRMLAEGSLNIW